MKIFISLALILSVSFTLAEETMFPQKFLGKWAPSLEQCKQFPWGDDAELIKIEGDSVIGYESHSTVSTIEERKPAHFRLTGSVSGEDMTSDFIYELSYIEEKDSIVIRYFSEGDQIHYVRCLE